MLRTFSFNNAWVQCDPGEDTGPVNPKHGRVRERRHNFFFAPKGTEGVAAGGLSPLMTPPPRPLQLLQAPLAGDLVRLGLVVGKPSTETCTGSAQRPLTRSTTQRDSNGVELVKALQKIWYRKCKKVNVMGVPGSTERRLTASNAGLLGSYEWKDVQPRLGKTSSPMFVLGTQVLGRVDRKTQRFGRGGMMYTLVYTTEQLIQLYKHFPPAQRLFNEVILPETPHKCIMDIERDLGESKTGLTPAQAEQEMAFMFEVLESEFLPLVIKFFNQCLGVAVTREHCYLTNSSRAKVKFSVHLVVHTPGVHVFRNRSEEAVAMMALAKHASDLAHTSVSFRRWYFHEDIQGKKSTTVDWCVYNTGTRNMRMLGCRKGWDTLVNQHWKHGRVFMPVQEGVPWHYYLSTAYSYTNRTPIRLNEQVVRDAYTFRIQLKRQPAPESWTIQLPNVMNIIRKQALLSAAQIKEIHDGLGIGWTPAVVTGGGGAGGGGVGVASHGRTSTEVDSYTRAIVPMGTEELPPEGSILYPVMQAQQQMKSAYIECLVGILQFVAVTLHPGNPISPSINDGEEDTSWMVRARMNAWIDGMNSNGRRCHFGCTQGSHQVVLSVAVDLSIGYFCFACRQRKILVDSPFNSQGVLPGLDERIIPEPFLSHVVDYTTEPPGPGEDAIHMRHIRPHSDTGKYLSSKMTVVLQGNMGTGKTQTTEAMVARLLEEKPEATILAISFRKMLASMFADRFGLVNYTSAAPGQLYEEPRVAIQLESLSKLSTRINTEDDEWVAQMWQDWDLIILDEIESVLAHFNSSTMKDRLTDTWKLFARLVTHAKVLVVCDADIEIRTFQFLGMMRNESDTDEVHIPGLQFHLNRYIPENLMTTFFDYGSIQDWIDKLIEALVDERKNIFLFSNNKMFMKQLECVVRDTVEDRRSRRICELGGESAAFSDEQVLEYTAILDGGILRIDAEMSESKKRQLSRCNEEWVKMRMVMISPTVGAGIDFTETHFHKAFGFGTSVSCSARSWNQMRGRCRFTIDRECHLFIDEAQQASDLSSLDEGPPGAPTNFDQAVDELKRNRTIYQGDMSEIQPGQTVGARGLMMITSVELPKQLQYILAMNNVENNRSRLCFRHEFITLLQQGNPHVNYLFKTQTRVKEDRELRVRLLENVPTVRGVQRNNMARQKDLSYDDFRKSVRMDGRGWVEGDEDTLDVPVVGGGDDKYSVHHKNDVKHFYGIKDGLKEEVWRAILRCGGETVQMDRVRNLALILCLDSYELYTRAVSTGDLGSMTFKVFKREDSQQADLVSVKQRTIQEVYPGDHVVRLWTAKLMYLSGFMTNPTSNDPSLNPANLIPGTKARVAHKYHGESRLQEDGAQQWLTEHARFIMQKSGIRENKNNYPGPGSEWEWKHVTFFTTAFLEKWFGICTKKGARKPAKRKRGEEETESSLLSTLGDAMTDEEIEFQYGTVSSSSTGSVLESGSAVSSAVDSIPGSVAGSVTTTAYSVGSRSSAVRSQSGFCCNGHYDQLGHRQKCRLMKIDMDILHTQLALAYCYLNKPLSRFTIETPERAAARSNITRTMRIFGMDNILDRIVDHPAITQGGAGPEAASAPEQDGGVEARDEESSGGEPESVAFMAYSGIPEEDEDPIFPSDSASQVGPEEEETVSIASGGGDLPPERQRPRVEHTEEGVPKKMAGLKTIQETHDMRQLTTAIGMCKVGASDEIAARVERTHTIRRYCGPNPFELDPVELVRVSMEPQVINRLKAMIQALVNP